MLNTKPCQLTDVTTNSHLSTLNEFIFQSRIKSAQNKNYRPGKCLDLGFPVNFKVAVDLLSNTIA